MSRRLAVPSFFAGLPVALIGAAWLSLAGAPAWAAIPAAAFVATIAAREVLRRI